LLDIRCSGSLFHTYFPFFFLSLSPVSGVGSWRIFEAFFSFLWRVQKFPFLSRVKAQNVLARLMHPLQVANRVPFSSAYLCSSCGEMGESFFLNLEVRILDWVVYSFFGYFRLYFLVQFFFQSCSMKQLTGCICFFGFDLIWDYLFLLFWYASILDDE